MTESNGHSSNGEAAVAERKPRPELMSLFASTRRAHATYDSARVGTDLDGHWNHADRYDADTSNSRTVRQRLVPRSRYEEGSNGYYSGILSTHVNMVVGVGPKLRMKTQNTEFNQLVEREWNKWWKAAGMRRKLWTMGHARAQDGESLGLLATDENLNHSVKLTLLLIETEQCQTPFLEHDKAGHLDGMRVDSVGNPVEYDILPQHPGSSNYTTYQHPIQVPASQVVHWLKVKRPNSHRGVPDLTSTLNTGAFARRHREATVTAAETAADISALIHSGLSPMGDAAPDPVAPLSMFELQRRVIMALPMGWDAKQMKGEHPNANYTDFHRQLLSEQARPISMPYNAAACDSSTYSFASGKLDTLCYRAAIDIERADCDELVLDRLFAAWFAEWTILRSQRDFPPAHEWDWPAHPVIDEKSHAQANDTNLKNGSITIQQVYAEAGEDFEDHLQVMASSYGVSIDEMRRILLVTHFPAALKVLPFAANQSSTDEGLSNAA